jgi:hypothetical protein
MKNIIKEITAQNKKIENTQAESIKAEIENPATSNQEA